MFRKMLKPFSVCCLGSKCLSPRPVLNNFTHDTVPFKQLMLGGQEVLWLVYKNTIHVVRIYIVQDMFFVAKREGSQQGDDPTNDRGYD